MELTLSIAKSTYTAFTQQKKSIIEDFLDKVLPSITNGRRLSEAMRYSVLNQGKRIRPLLVYATGYTLGVPDIKLHAAAASVELIHCYSLIHDDLPAMDDDDLRRGIPSCHKAFDEATAILAGDALQSLAFEVLADSELNPVSATQQAAMVITLAKAVGAQGMVLGQVQDLEAENRLLELGELTTLHRHKTGALFSSCIELGLLACDKPINQEIRQQLLTYSDNLGLAFQIQDDILDVIGDHQIIGKPVGSDQKLNKSTFTSLLGLDIAKEHAKHHSQLALQALDGLGSNADILRELANYLLSRDS